MNYKGWEKLFVEAVHSHVRLSMNTTAYKYIHDEEAMKGLFKIMTKHFELVGRTAGSSSDLILLSGLYGVAKVFITVRIKIWDNNVDKSAYILVYPQVLPPGRPVAAAEFDLTNGRLCHETLRLEKLMF